MIYDSLKLFLDQFCEPVNCSSALGMEFLVKSDLIESLTNEQSIWILISPDFDTLEIKCIFDEEDNLGEFVEANSQVPLMEANFQKVMTEIEELVKKTQQEVQK